MTFNPTTIDTSLQTLRGGAVELPKATLNARIRIASEILQLLLEHSHTWVDACCRGKSITTAAARSEEVLAGPASTARYLRLLIQSLTAIEQHGRPSIPGKIKQLSDGRLCVPVFPAKGIYDSITFMGLRAELWMKPGVRTQTLHGTLLEPILHPSSPAPIALVLGAGNVSSISATDAFAKLFQECKVVLLKLNPVNEYLADVFSKIFQPVIERGWLQIICGGAAAGEYACQHEAVSEVHITGSHHTHDAIVWGSPAEQAAHKAANTPVLSKPITSELGNVSPWIIVPGQYSEKELRCQAINLAASLVNNAGFNCLTTRVIVTGKQWTQRQHFLELLRSTLKQIPERVPYYPGAQQRFEKFTGQAVPETGETLPWTLLEDVPPADHSILFTDESFVCAYAEVQLDGTPQEFLKNAARFCNEKLFGTLCIAITMPDPFQHSETTLINSVISSLNYGSVCINQWPGLVYGLMTPPWGAAPDGDLCDIESGLGHVHNLYFLEQFEKTVFYGPLCNFPKPVWFPSHKRAEQIGWKLVELYANPSLTKLPGLLVPAILG